MAVVDVRNLEGKTVGQVDLADAVFAAERESAPAARSGALVSWPASAPERTRPRAAAKFPAPAASCGGRRAPAARASARFALRSGARAARCTVRSRAVTLSRFRRRWFWARCARRFRPSWRTQKLTVVDGWTLGSHKTKDFRQALTRLDGKTRTMLVVESAGKPQSRAGQPQPGRREGGGPGGAAALRSAAPRSHACFRRIRRCIWAARSGPGSHAAAAGRGDAERLRRSPRSAKPRQPKAKPIGRKAAKARGGEVAAKPKAPRKASGKPKAKE